MHPARLPVDFRAQRGGNAMQPGSGNFLEIPFFDFLLQLFKLPGEHLPAFVALAKDALGQPLRLRGAEVGDLELMLAAPLDERGLGDVQFDGDAVEAPALRAQEDEAGDGFLVVHKFGFLTVAAPRHPVSDGDTRGGRGKL